MSPYRTPATMPVEPDRTVRFRPTFADGIWPGAVGCSMGGVINVLVWGYSPMVFFDVGITFALMMVWHWRYVRRLAR